MIKNLRVSKKIACALLSVGIVASGTLGGMKLYKTHEVNRVKGYLNDFLTEENYVDLSKISTAYDIKGFSGETLYEALQGVHPRYVRIGDEYIFDIYDGVVVTPFKQMTAMDKSQLMGYDDDGNPVYVGYEPIRNSGDDGISYDYPDGYELEEVSVIQEPFDYERLFDREIVVRENEYEKSYSLSLERKK